jgi:hypothetical protein
MPGLKNFLLKPIILAVMLLGLPLTGVLLAGYPVLHYLEFPPRTHFVQHAAFSWIAFAAYSLAILSVAVPIVIKGMRPTPVHEHPSPELYPLPWWGWLGLLLCLVSWILAWSRFSWFARFQPHTFSPLWFSFILVINSLCYRQTGRCLMLDRPGYFLLLFPTSAAFWWFFEYLNRFVQNWHYTGPELSSQQYFWYATLPFSTVLPAVLSTRQWLLSAGWIKQRFSNFIEFTIPCPRMLAGIILVISAGGLAGVGVWPNYLFPLLWVSPLLIIIGLQVLMQERHMLMQMAAGDWRFAVASVLAALFCGWFWEMWNYCSLAKWEYSIPFVHGFKIFEMPVLGYAGYLPFGLECSAVGAMLAGVMGFTDSEGR